METVEVVYWYLVCAMADEIGFKVEKLTADTYFSWKFNMHMYLMGKDLWEIVSGTEVLAQDEADANVRSQFKKREQKAMSAICLSVSTPLQIYVRNVKTAKEAWDQPPPVQAVHINTLPLLESVHYT